MAKPIGVILTDTHLDRDNVDAQLSIFKQAIDLAKELGLSEVWHGGDIFESRKSQPLGVLDAFDRILSLFEESEITLVAIPGNHDKVNYDSEKSYLDVFRHHPNFKLVRTYALQHAEPAEDHSMVTVHFLPYFLESGSYIDRLNDIKIRSGKNDKDILITHIAVNGVRNNDGSKVENDLNRTAFKKFDSVFVGHYHDQSSIHNVHYIGSALQKNFGEDTNKGFTIVYDDGSHKFVKSMFTEFITLKIDVENTPKQELEGLLKDYADSTDNIRFKFSGEKSKLVAIDKSKFERAGIDIKFDSTDITVDTSIVDTNEFVQFNKDAVLKEFKEFCKKEKYKATEGLEYLNKIL